MKRRPIQNQGVGMSGFGPFIDGIGVLLVDRELRVIDADAAMAALSGRPAVEQAGRLVRELYPLLAPALEAMLQGVLATGEPARDCELRGELRADEPVRWLVSFEPVRTRSGAVLAVECFVRALA
jgi:PAS domain-containing protein